MGMGGQDRASIRNWLKDLTFAEAHAMTYGFVHGAGVVAAFGIGLPELSVALLGVLFVLNGWLQTEKTKNVPIVTSIIEALPKRIVGQIRGELHYYDGAWIIGLGIAYGLGAWVGVV